MSSRLQVSFSCHNIWKFISQIYEINVVKRPTCLAKTLIQESSPVYAKQNARQLPNFHKLHTNPTKLISQDLQRFSCRNLIIVKNSTIQHFVKVLKSVNWIFQENREILENHKITEWNDLWKMQIWFVFYPQNTLSCRQFCNNFHLATNFQQIIRKSIGKFSRNSK